MPVSPGCQIHPTAIVSPEAELGPDVRVGPFAIIEGLVAIGAGCVIGARAHVVGPVTMGKNNQLYQNAVIGERPQHFTYADEPTSVEIGDDNTFRENVTIHRGTSHAWKTRIGDGNYFMAGSHVGHDCIVGNKCILINNALLGGHVVMEDGAYVSGNSAVHQHCRLGRLSFLSGASASTKDIPPFIIQQEVNIVVGVNVVGMRRAGMSSQQISAIRRAYHIAFLQNQSLPNALRKIEGEIGHIDVAREFIDFIRASKRGINAANVDWTEMAA